MSTTKPCLFAALLLLASCADPEPPVTPATETNGSSSTEQEAPAPSDSNGSSEAAPATPDEPKPLAAPLPAADLVLQALAAGDVKSALELALELRETHGAHPRALFVHALALHKHKRYAEARPLFQAAAASPETFPGAERLPYYQGWCTYWLADFDAAAAHFSAHAAQAGEPDSHFGLGIIALELGDLERAELELQRARAGFQERLDGGDLFSTADVAKAQARLADVALARDEDEAARDLLKQALALDAGRAAVWFKLYQVALALDDQELVALAKRKYEQLSPNTESVAPMGSGMGTGQ